MACAHGRRINSRINPGAPLLTIVPLDQLWIDADFKESELRDIRVGQPAIVEADRYDSEVTFHVKVLALPAGTGSAFLPISVSRSTRKELAAHPLRVGLSATASIDIMQKGGGALGAVAAPPPQRYATTALHQPVERARAAIDAIVANNLAN